MTWLAFRQHRVRMVTMALIVALWAGLAAVEHGFPGLRGISAGLFPYIPLVLGVFLGAPLVSREFERGTHQLAWTQSITRSRWFLPQTLVALALAVLTTAGTSALAWWSLGGLPWKREVNDTLYVLTGALPYAWAVFAVAIGVAWSAITRRTTVAMGASFFGVAATQLIAEGLRNRADRELDWPLTALQSAEAGVLTALAALLGVAAWWCTTRRDPA
ncbi:ABC transporter permease [Acrocarpospora catenulata]|uniref:ABC transporter permease n=1 Tax=Acrocarpospora catenulata TaxID=2836182 RepID=UPI001BDAB161|nr:ABC transporter permease subunit [Acrocarpospora catenulata]